MVPKETYDPDFLFNLMESVRDEASFLGFLRAVSEDFALERATEKIKPSPPYSMGALGWENGSVDAVFDAAHSFGIATQGEWNTTHDNIWRRCAEIVLAGKFYE